MKRTFPHTFVILGTCVLVSLSGFTQAQKSDERIIQNPKPTELSLTPMNEREAVVAARFPGRKPGTEVKIVLGDERVVLNDRGENGDEKPRDGVFSTATKFDSKQFVEANQIFAKANAERKQPLFSPGGREQIGVQTVIPKGDHLIIDQELAEKPRRFVLPLTLEVIEFRRPIELPVLGPELGLPFEPVLANAVDASESLMITKLETVNDPDRTWFCENANQPPAGNPEGRHTFWQSMADMNNGAMSTSDFIKEFFAHWASNQNIGGHLIEARPHVFEEVIREWEIRSGGPGAELLPEQSPFRLLGIVLRADLRGPSSFYGGGNAGEGRLVFGLHDGNCNPMRKSIILEYQVPISGCSTVKNWAQRWIELDGSSNYNAELEELTQVFTSANANPGGPNGSAIAQVRTTEFIAQSESSELREFVLPDGGGVLVQTTTKQEPQAVHNNESILADYINSNIADLLAFNHQVPPTFDSTGFLAGNATPAILWNAPEDDLDSALDTPAGPPAPPGTSKAEQGQFVLAFNTCSGCHQVETDTNFAHLHYHTPPGEEAWLSGFLTGHSMPDPRSPHVLREFNDLERREEDLLDLANQSCPTITVLPGNVLVNELTRAPALNAVH